MAARSVILPLYTSYDERGLRRRKLLWLALNLLLAGIVGALSVALPSEDIFYIVLFIASIFLIVLWMLPDVGRFPIVPLLRLFIVFLATTILWPIYLAVVLPGLPWVTPARAVLLIMSGILIYSLFTSAVLRKYIVDVFRKNRGVLVLLLLWELCQVITVPFSAQPGLSIAGVFNNQLRFIVPLIVAIIAAAQRGMATKLVTVLVGAAVIMCLDGFIELRMGMPPWANHIPSFLKIDDKTLVNVLGTQARSADGLYRVRGPFSISLSFAEFLALAIPFVLHRIVVTRAAFLKLVMLIIWVMIMIGIFISRSRLGLVAVLVSHSFYALLFSIRTWRNNKSSLIAASALFLFPVILAVFMTGIFGSHTATLTILGGGAQAASDQSRHDQWSLGIPKIMTNPIGHGQNTSGDVLGYVGNDGRFTVDSYFLTLALDVGIGGLVGFIGFIALTIWNGSISFISAHGEESELQGPIVASLLSFIFIKSVLSQTENHYLIFVMCGLSLGLSYWGKRGHHPVGSSDLFNWLKKTWPHTGRAF